MSGETSSRVSGQDRVAARDRAATGAEPRPLSFAGQRHPVHGTKWSDEPAGNDRWTAVMSAFLFAVLAALLTWLLMAIAGG